MYLFKYIQIFVICSVVRNTKWYFSTENSNQRARWISLINEVSQFCDFLLFSISGFSISFIALVSIRRIISIFNCFSINFRHPAPDRAFRLFSTLTLHTWIYFGELHLVDRRRERGFIPSCNICFQTKTCSSISSSNDFSFEVIVVNIISSLNLVNYSNLLSSEHITIQ